MMLAFLSRVDAYLDLAARTAVYTAIGAARVLCGLPFLVAGWVTGACVALVCVGFRDGRSAVRNRLEGE